MRRWLCGWAAILVLCACKAERPGAAGGSSTGVGGGGGGGGGATAPCAGAACGDAGSEAGPTDCPSGRALCGMSCVDTASNPEHCGACDAQCPSPQVCSSGICSSGCPAGTVTCDGRCIEPNADPIHCGATAGCGADGGTLGTVCGASSNCYGGQCITDCGDLFACVAPGGGTSCLDLKNDAANCGSCGHHCAAGKSCSQGTCCAPNEAACMGVCRNLQTSALACGGCGISCGADQSCSSGGCVP
jgi:hypothetical protein